MPKVVDHDQRRAAIAAAAAEAIADDGIDAVTMKGIAERAGVTTGAVTHYFADKDEVLLAALLLVDASMQTHLDAAMALGQSSVDSILDALPHDDDSRRYWTVWRVFSDRASRSPALLAQYRASTEGWVDAGARAIAAQAAVSGEAARLDAEILVAVVDAIGDAASVDPDRWPVERQRRVVEHLLARLGGDARTP